MALAAATGWFIGDDELRGRVGGWWDRQSTSWTATSPPVQPEQVSTLPPSLPIAEPELSPTPRQTSESTLTVPVPSPTVTIVQSSIPTASPTPSARTKIPLSRFTNGAWLERNDPILASSIKQLDWFGNGMEAYEESAIQTLLYMSVESIPFTESVVALAWVQDGINETESGAMKNLQFIAHDSSVAALTLVSFDWLRDGVEEVEIEALQRLRNFGTASAPVMVTLVGSAWMLDGLDSKETEAVRYMSYLANRHLQAAQQSIAMPFMETIEPHDVAALDSLRRLARDDSALLDQVLSRMDRSGGITDDYVPIVATLAGVASTNPVIVERLLDPSIVTLEKRTISLPLAGEISLAIVRTQSGAARSMDLLEHSVRNAEEFMNTPFPTKFVALLYEDAVHGSNAGTNFRTHIAILPKYDVDDGSREAEFAASNIAHEVAHYYWSGNADWVDEGASDLMASASEAERLGTTVEVTNTPCAYAATLGELESLNTDRNYAAFTCNYALGERLLVDLYRSLGKERFQEAFRRLYLSSEIEDAEDDRTGTMVGIKHVLAEFQAVEAAASDIIARWYDGTIPHDLSRLDASPVSPNLSGIAGRIDAAYVALGTNGPARSEFSSQAISDWILLTLKISNQVSNFQQETQLEIVEAYQDGIVVRRRTVTVTAEAGHIGSTYYYSVGSPPSKAWAVGRYYVYVYEGDRKVAEVQYTVTRP